MAWLKGPPPFSLREMSHWPLIKPLKPLQKTVFPALETAQSPRRMVSFCIPMIRHTRMFGTLCRWEQTDDLNFLKMFIPIRTVCNGNQPVHTTQMLIILTDTGP